MSQRLARGICPHCKIAYYPSQDLLERAGWTDRKAQPFQRGEGCRQCHNSGYKGRVGIYEVMPFDSELERLVHARADEQRIREYLSTTEYTTLREESLSLVEEGFSSLEEVLRVTVAEQEESSHNEAVDENSLHRN